jgi:carbon-monoxide dehydrogenase large subunit
VRFLGEPVAMVLATSKLIAIDAAELVEVDYEPLPAVTGVDTALAKGAPAVWDAFPDNQAFFWSKGDEVDVEATLKASHHVAKITSHSTRVSANAMEPRAATGVTEDGKLTLYISHQSPHQMRDILATQLGLEKTDVRVVCADVGGSFGMKSGPLREEALVLWATKRLKRPVRWIADRSESFLSDEHARDIHFEASLGVDKKGHFTALAVRYKVNIGAYFSGRSTSPIGNFGGIAGVYRTPKILGQVTGVYTNTQATAAYRGAGRPDATLVIERLIDIAARDMKIDPFAIRMRNLIPSSAMPYQTPFVFKYDCGDFEKTMKRAAELIDYDGFKARRKESKKRGRLRGIGIANPIEVAGGPYGKEATDWAWVDVNADGSVVLRAGAQSTGQGHDTAMSDLISQRLNVPFDKVKFVSGDTDAVPRGKGHGGSGATTLCASAISLSVDQIIEQGRKIAADKLETEAADIEFADGNFKVAGTDRSVSFADVARLATKDGGHLAGTSPFKMAQASFPNGCHICEIEIIPETGEVIPLKYVSVEDVGTVLNPTFVDAQIHGGVAQGMGQALKELIVHEEGSGQLVTGSFMDYGMPRATDMPPIVCDNIVVPTRLNPLGVKGVGEAGTVGSLAATINAVCDALSEYGVTDFQMPATSDRVWQAIQDAQGLKQAAE